MTSSVITGVGPDDGRGLMGQGTYPAGITRASLVLCLTLGLALAAVVCTDPILSHFLNFRYFEKYPYLLTASVATLGILAWSLAIRAQQLRERHEVLLFILPIVLCSQLVGLNFAKLDPLEVTLTILTLVWVATMLAGTQHPIRSSANLAMILGLIGLAFLAAINEPLGVFIHAFLALSVKFVAFFMLSQFVRTIALVRSAVRVMIGVGVFAALAGIGQVVLYLTTHIILTCALHKKLLFKETPWGQFLRATGFSPKPQHLSAFLVVVLPVLLFVTFLPGVPPRRRWLGLLGLLIVCTGITLTLTVTAWFAMILVFVLFLYFRWPSRSIHFTAIFAAGGTLVYVSGLFQWVYRNYVVNSGLFKGEGQRWYLMSLAFEELRRKPLVGIGLWNFASFTKNFRRLEVHDAYFQAATELGIVGGILFVSILLYTFIRLLYLNSHVPDANETLRIRVLLLGLITLMFSAIAEPTFDHPNTWVFLGILDGAIMTYLLKLREGWAPLSPALTSPAGGGA